MIEIKLNKLDTVKNDYRFCVQDLNEGLNYGISKEFYNRAASILGFDKIEENTDNKTYCNIVYTKLLKVNKDDYGHK